MDDEAASYRPPKLPKTQAEKDTAKRLVVILEGACLETVKVFFLLLFFPLLLLHIYIKLGQESMFYPILFNY